MEGMDGGGYLTPFKSASPSSPSPSQREKGGDILHPPAILQRTVHSRYTTSSKYLMPFMGAAISTKGEIRRIPHFPNNTTISFRDCWRISPSRQLEVVCKLLSRIVKSYYELPKKVLSSAAKALESGELSILVLPPLSSRFNITEIHGCGGGRRPYERGGNSSHLRGT